MFHKKLLLVMLLGVLTRSNIVSCASNNTRRDNITFYSAGFTATFIGTISRICEYNKLARLSRTNFLIRTGIRISNLALISLLAGTGYKDLCKQPSTAYATPALLAGGATGVIMAAMPLAAGQAGLVAGSHIGKLVGNRVSGAQIGQAALFTQAALVSSAAMTAASYRTVKGLLPALRN